MWTFIFAGLALISLVLLSASLKTIQFEPGRPFSFSQLAPSVVDSTIPNQSLRLLTAIFRVVLILGWIVLPLYIILLIIDKKERKRFIRDMIMFLTIAAALYFLLNQRSAQQPNAQTNPLGGLLGTPAPPGPLAPPPTPYVPPPAWVTMLASILIAGAITLIVVGIFYSIWKRSHDRLQSSEPLRAVQREAQSALDALEAGGDLREIILRCYYQMAETLRESRGIQRNFDMTPHEFEIYLERRGLPRDPIHQLTQVFEQVRYGGVKPG